MFTRCRCHWNPCHWNRCHWNRCHWTCPDCVCCGSRCRCYCCYRCYRCCRCCGCVAINITLPLMLFRKLAVDVRREQTSTFVCTKWTRKTLTCFDTDEQIRLAGSSNTLVCSTVSQLAMQFCHCTKSDKCRNKPEMLS